MNTKLHSMPFEQAVLAALMTIDQCYEQLDVKPTMDDFYAGRHKLIYQAIEHLANQGKKYDAELVHSHLEMTSQLDNAGGERYLMQIMSESTTSLFNVNSYVEKIRKFSERRKIEAAGQEIIKLAQISDSEDLVGKAQQCLTGIESSEVVNTRYHVADASVKALEIITQRLERQKNNTGLAYGVNTGLRDVDDLVGDIEPTHLCIVAARPAMGKAQPHSAKILLADGKFTTMGEIAVGDKLASVDGKSSVVAGKYPQGIRPIYQVILDDGRTVEADQEHLWVIESSKFDGQRTVTTKRLLEMLECVRYQGRLRLASHNGDFGSHSNLGIDPWLLGFLIGDGSLTQGGIKFSTGEEYILEKITAKKAIGEIKHVANSDYRIIAGRNVYSSDIQALKDLGLYGKLSQDKFVPDVVFTSHKEVRQQVLAGLLESDGWVEKFGCVMFSSSSEQLTDGVIQLVRSLGGKATKRVKENVSYVKDGVRIDCLNSYTTSIALNDLVNLLDSPRLTKNMKPRKYSCQPIIRAVVYSRDEEATCIKVSHPSELYITDGYAVTHNTTLAQMIAINATRRNNAPTLFVSCEMTADQVTSRIVSALGQIPYSRIRKGTMNEDDYQSWINTTAQVLNNLPLEIEEKAGATILDIREYARKIKAQYGKVGVIIIDYLQLLRDPRQKNRFDEISEISRQLKKLAKDFHCPVIALSQLSRDCEKRPNKRPMLSDLRESGQIEQDADQILFLYRDEVYNKDSKDVGIAEIIVGKNRHGESGTARVATRLHYCHFTNLRYEEGV